MHGSEQFKQEDESGQQFHFMIPIGGKLQKKLLKTKIKQQMLDFSNNQIFSEREINNYAFKQYSNKYCYLLFLLQQSLMDDKHPFKQFFPSRKPSIFNQIVNKVMDCGKSFNKLLGIQIIQSQLNSPLRVWDRPNNQALLSISPEKDDLCYEVQRPQFFKLQQVSSEMSKQEEGKSVRMSKRPIPYSQILDEQQNQYKQQKGDIVSSRMVLSSSKRVTKIRSTRYYKQRDQSEALKKKSQQQESSAVAKLKKICKKDQKKKGSSKKSHKKDLFTFLKRKFPKPKVIKRDSQGQYEVELSSLKRNRPNPIDLDNPYEIEEPTDTKKTYGCLQYLKFKTNINKKRLQRMYKEKQIKDKIGSQQQSFQEIDSTFNNMFEQEDKVILKLEKKIARLKQFEQEPKNCKIPAGSMFEPIIIPVNGDKNKINIEIILEIVKQDKVVQAQKPQEPQIDQNVNKNTSALSQMFKFSQMPIGGLFGGPLIQKLQQVQRKEDKVHEEINSQSQILSKNALQDPKQKEGSKVGFGIESEKIILFPNNSQQKISPLPQNKDEDNKEIDKGDNKEILRQDKKEENKQVKKEDEKKVQILQKQPNISQPQPPVPVNPFLTKKNDQNYSSPFKLLPIFMNPANNLEKQLSAGSNNNNNPNLDDSSMINQEDLQPQSQLQPNPQPNFQLGLVDQTININNMNNGNNMNNIGNMNYFGVNTSPLNVEIGNNMNMFAAFGSPAKAAYKEFCNPDISLINKMFPNNQNQQNSLFNQPASPSKDDNKKYKKAKKDNAQRAFV